MRKAIAALTVATSMLALTGCGLVQNAAYREGYDLVKELHGKQGMSNGEAFAYCSTLSSYASVETEEDLNDWVAGCIDYATE